jgi:cbb3-type cytochrome oxidase subunit 1
LGVHLQYLAAREGALIVPSLTVWCVRMALLYLGLGFTLGALMLSSPVLGVAPAVLKLRPLHAEILLVGWMAQLAFGVAYWILPRLPGNRPRGSEQLAWLSLTLLNAGVLAVGLGQILNAPTSVSAVGRGAEALAVFGFAIHAWSRAWPSTASR